MKLGEVKTGHFDRGQFPTFRVSNLGRCQRSVQYSVMGFRQEEVPEKTKLMWKERLEDESRIVSFLKKKYKLKYAGGDHLTFHRRVVDLSCILSGTPDGLVKKKGDWIPLEIKSLNPFRFNVINKREDLSREYFLQTQGEMIVTGTDRLLYVIGNSKTKKDFKEFEVTLDEKIGSWIGKRIEHILGFIKNKKIIHPEYAQGSKNCYWCLYKIRCKKDVYKYLKFSYTNTVKLSKDDFDYGLVSKAGKTIKSLLEQIEDFDLQIRSVQAEARNFMMRFEASEIKAGRDKIILKDLIKLERRIKG